MDIAGLQEKGLSADLPQSLTDIGIPVDGLVNDELEYKIMKPVRR